MKVLRVDEDREMVELEWNGITIAFQSRGGDLVDVVGRGKLSSTRADPGDTDVPKEAFRKMRRQAIAIIEDRRRRHARRPVQLQFPQ